MPSIACDDASTHGKFISNVFYTTSNLVNSRRCQDEDCKEMYQNSMEIEKEIASNNNNMSSFKNKWSPLKLCPSDK